MIFRIVIASGFLFATACNQNSKSEEAFSHEVSSNTLKSEAFGVSVTKPDEWYAVNKELFGALTEEGGKIASQGKEDLAQRIERSKSRTSQLFGIFKFEPGAPVPSNPSVLAMAENVSLTPGIKTGSDYFYHFRSTAAYSNVKYDFEDEIASVQIGGQNFDRMNTVMTVSGSSVNQSYYAARRGDSIILFIQSYKSPEEKSETDAILATIKFDKER